MINLPEHGGGFGQREGGRSSAGSACGPGKKNAVAHLVASVRASRRFPV